MTAAVLSVLLGVFWLGYESWPSGSVQSLTQAVTVEKEPHQQAEEIIFSDTDGNQVPLPLRIIKAELHVDDGTNEDLHPFSIPDAVNYKIPPEVKDALQAVLVYRDDMMSGYVLLAPIGWDASASVGANGSFGVTLTNPANKEQSLRFSDTAGSCQGCAINSIGTYFPEQAGWAEEQGFAVYEPLSFADWEQRGATGEDASTAAYTTRANDGFYEKGVAFYEKHPSGKWFLFRQLKFTLSENISLVDQSYEVILDLFAAHHGPLIVPLTHADSITSEIPVKMDPGTILTYRLNDESMLTYDIKYDEYDAKSQQTDVRQEAADLEARKSEDDYIASIKDSVKHLPVVDLGFDLPAPAPGVAVMYGSDGYINRVWKIKDK
nr:DUF4850 domain-containing protein [Paenibacillus lemnae]